MDFMSADGFGSVLTGVTSVIRPSSIMAVKAPQWELCFRWNVLDISQISAEANGIIAVGIFSKNDIYRNYLMPISLHSYLPIAFSLD